MARLCVGKTIRAKFFRRERMKFKSLLLTGVAAAMLAGCSTQNVNAVRDYAEADDSFNSHLASEYRDLAVFEHDLMFDMRDAGFFARKSLAASQGEAVAPSAVTDRKLPDFAVTELSTAHDLLTDALGKPEYQASPARLARAQAKFDCWMEQQEENIQPDHIAACKIEFYEALRALTGQNIAVIRDTIEAYFDHDSAKLDDDAMQAIRQAADVIKGDARMNVLLTGNADTSGADDYNEQLSKRRAMAVRSALLQQGLPTDRVRILAKGEKNLMVQTGDNVRERKNRRVDILISEKVD